MRFESSSAPPPAHAVAFVVVAAILCFASLPSLSDLDSVATIDVVASPVLISNNNDDDVYNLATLRISICRLLFASFILAVTARRVTNKGVSPQPTYLPQSRLKSAPLPLKGIRSLAPFTLWCWILLGISFALSGYVSLLRYLGWSDGISPWILRLALLSFEISAPMAFLVSFMVKYFLWPHALKEKGSAGTDVFRSFYGLAMHNLNIIFVLCEVALLGGLPIDMRHISVAPIFGLLYVQFAWWMSTRWGGVTNGSPQFLYFFLDTTLGWTTTFALAGLLLTLLVFFIAFSFIDDFFEHIEGGIIVRSIAVISGASLVCRFRD